MVAAANHPLAKKRRIHWDALRDEPFIFREPGSATRQFFDHLLQAQSLPVRVTMELSGNETIKQAVMAGMGLSFLSMRTVRHELASGHIALLDIEGMPQVGHWYVTHLSQKKLSPAAQAFKSFLIEQGGALMDSWS